MLVRLSCIAALLSAVLGAASPPLKPVRVCEALRDLNAYDGKVVAIVGRFSFRDAGRFLSEEVCEKKLQTDDFVWPCALRVAFNSRIAPKPPQPLEFDAQVVNREIKLVREHTSLGKFRFGTPDYDRWAVVFGRIEISTEYRSGDKPGRLRTNGLEPAPAQLLCGGDGDIVFLTGQQ